MHFEVPKAKTLREFAGEYLMIVISIMTALALEHGAQALYHKSVAQEASEKINAEIHANIDEIAKTLSHNRTEADKLTVIRKALLTEIRSGTSNETLQKNIINKYEGAFSLSIRTPTMRREAWDVAVANQAVSWMPAKDLKRYSIVYASMRDVQAISVGGNTFLDGAAMLNTQSNVQMGGADPRETYRMLNQMIFAYNMLNGNLSELEKELRSAAAAPSAG